MQIVNVFPITSQLIQLFSFKKGCQWSSGQKIQYTREPNLSINLEEKRIFFGIADDQKEKQTFIETISRPQLTGNDFKPGKFYKCVKSDLKEYVGCIFVNIGPDPSAKTCNNITRIIKGPMSELNIYLTSVYWKFVELSLEEVYLEVEKDNG